MLNSTIKTNSSARKLRHTKLRKIPFNKKKIAAIKTKKVLTNILLPVPGQICKIVLV